jgi:hypothetical protein
MSDDDMSDLIAVVNRIRRENPALQQNATLKFHTTDNESRILLQQVRGR